MKQEPRRSIARSIANGFGALGYFFCTLQWVWAILLYFSVIHPVILFLAPPADQQIEPSAPVFTPPSQLEIIILAVVTAAMVALTIYVLIKMPLMIAKAGRAAVHKTSKTVAPMVVKAQRKKDTKKRRAWITARLILILKVLLVVIPAILTVLSGLFHVLTLDYSIVVIIGGGLAGFSVLFFVVQYLVARLRRVAMVDLW